MMGETNTILAAVAAFIVGMVWLMKRSFFRASSIEDRLNQKIERYEAEREKEVLELKERLDRVSSKLEEVTKEHFILKGRYEELSKGVELKNKQHEEEKKALGKKILSLEQEVAEREIRLQQLQKQVNIIDPSVKNMKGRRKGDL